MLRTRSPRKHMAAPKSPRLSKTYTPGTIIHAYENPYKVFDDFCTSYIQQLRKNNPTHSKMAIVFDIDDTAILTRNSKPLQTFQKFYNLAVQLKFNIFFITARVMKPENIKYTQQQLIKFFPKYNRLYMMPVLEMYERSNWSYYKYNCRKDIVNKGFNIVLNFGDVLHDLSLSPEFMRNVELVRKYKQLKNNIKPNMYYIIVPVCPKYDGKIGVKMKHRDTN